MNILISQSDKEFTDMMKIWFKEYGFKVDVAYDGEECLQKILSNDYDAVLLNLLQAKLDSIEIIKKAKEKKEDVKIIVTTNINTKVSIETTREAGAYGYEVMTEVTPYQLAENIKRYIKSELTAENSFSEALKISRRKED